MKCWRTPFRETKRTNYVASVDSRVHTPTRIPGAQRKMDVAGVKAKVNDVLRMEVRTPETVVECLGVDFVERHEHLTAMLCRPNMDVKILCRMLSCLETIRTQEDQDRETEKIGLELATKYIPAVREQQEARSKPE